ncbi:hypothetical protein KCTC52924_01407 [Arenibacter antarcticus]|uniref:Uncharacterized protein n=1 Tax=Arenibacter antarcticus TaxID=2040469 RepID=A0ABW5VDV9_9FLAO|nr:hypothetical protein [Arenibacter sp. H213]MCM4167789.1 hypothetical protein [Arenibacter sp. H213]
MLTSFFHAQKEVGKEGIFDGTFTHGDLSETFRLKKTTDYQVFFTSLEQNTCKTPVRDIDVKKDYI